MDIMRFLGDRSSPRSPDPHIEHAITAALTYTHTEIEPHLREYLEDPQLFKGLPGRITEDPETFALYIENSSNFQFRLNYEGRHSEINLTDKILGESATAPAVLYEGGKTSREPESGSRLNFEVIKKLGIDPSKVLFFRCTQPQSSSKSAKPEYYWTTDFAQVKKGIGSEIGEDKWVTSVILVADLATIARDKGLIVDRNDSEGLSVRQLDTAAFPQENCIAIIPTFATPPQSFAPPRSREKSSDEPFSFF